MIQRRPGVRATPLPSNQDGRRLFQQRYAIFDTSCLGRGATFINYALLRKHAPFYRGIPTESTTGNKQKCEDCGSYILSNRKLRHFETFHSELDVSNSEKEFERLSSIAVYPSPRETCGKVFECSRCEAFCPNVVLLQMHSKRRNGLSSVGGVRISNVGSDAPLSRGVSGGRASISPTRKSN